MITIIDYGMGNLGSIKNMLKKVGDETNISSDISDIEKADKLILPGVGSFGKGMKNIKDLGLDSLLNNLVIKQKKPIFGICLGMQLFSNSSMEGNIKGLGWIDAETIKFDFNDNSFKIPHMGWNTIDIRKEDQLFDNLFENSRFYFVHSYHMYCKKRDDVLATTSYGYDFPSIVKKENIIGVQFHPEKSHKYGMKLLKNFTEMIY